MSLFFIWWNVMVLSYSKYWFGCLKIILMCCYINIGLLICMVNYGICCCWIMVIISLFMCYVKSIMKMLFFVLLGLLFIVFGYGIVE